MADEICWLIERADPNNPVCVLPNSFLGIDGYWNGNVGSGNFKWLVNANDALRFSRRKDAAMFAGALSEFQDRLVHYETLPGIRSGDPKPIIVEHAWA